MTVADPGVTVYPGEPGAFAEEAARTIGPGTLEPIGLAGFREVFTAVSAGAAPRPDGPDMPVAAGVLPIENVLGGTVRETYDLLLEFELEIVGEVIVPVHLCLAALPGQRLDQVDRVYSHVQALAQAERFLRTRPWTLLTTYNTAAAAPHGGRAGGTRRGGRRLAAGGLAVRPGGPRHRDRGHARRPDPLPGRGPAGRLVRRRGGAVRAGTSSAPMRTTLVLGLANEPGSLVRALRVLADGGLNMSKLESRPLPGRAWQYVFWIDLDADAAGAGGRRDPRAPPRGRLVPARAGQLSASR